jgi:altronate dehydratase
MPTAFKIHQADNVATLLADSDGVVEVQGAGALALKVCERIAASHKVALFDIAEGEAVIKYGVRIGHAKQPIARGSWVHLHNLASDLDERSGTLHLHSGAPTDTVYE